MARLILQGTVADVEILHDPKDEECILARCIVHPGHLGCAWTERYDTHTDAIEYAATHADGRRS